MTRCAGTCQYDRGGGCRIKLSEPLLKFRPVLELKETLLHEMIHAYCFLNKLRDRDPTGHGAPFLEKMHFINRAAFPDSQRPSQGYNITVFHSMHAEVENYQVHHWTCQRCGKIIKRAMNRPPQPADCRNYGKGERCIDPKCAHHVHETTCGGEWNKTAEPAGFGQKRKGPRKQPAAAGGMAVPAKRPRTGGQPAAGQRGTILDFLQSGSSAGDTSSQPPPGGSCPEQAVSDRLEYAGGGRQPGGAAAGGSQQADGEQRRSNQPQAAAAEARLHQGTPSAASDGSKLIKAKLTAASHVEAVIDLADDEDEVSQAAAANAQTALACPVCGLVWSSTISNRDMNSHIDQCLNF